MPADASAREADWTRLLLPAAVLVASVAACSVMPPAGASARVPVCRPEAAAGIVGRAASAPLIEQARRASGSDRVHLVMPGDPRPQVAQLDRLVLQLDEHSLVTRATCG